MRYANNKNKEQSRFRDFSSKSMRVRFNDNAKPEIIFAKQFLPIEQTFKVQIEEEITEDTMIPHLYDLLENNSLCRWSPATISDLKTSKSRAFYIMNDDMTMTLIWRDGKLVD